MKVVHLISDLCPGSGGTTRAVIDLAHAQAREGWDVSVVSTDWSVGAVPSVGKVQISLVSCDFTPWFWSAGFKSFFSGMIAKADMVHIHKLWDYPVWAGASVCRRLSKPYLISLHGMLDRWSIGQKSLKKRWYLNWLGRSILRGAAAIHFTSHREWANSVLHGYGEKTFVSPLGLAETAYQELPDVLAFQRRYPELTGYRIILYLGRLHHKKQPELVIQTFSLIADSYPDTCLVIGGSGDEAYVAELKKIAAKSGFAQRIFFKGMMSGPAVQEAYRAASFFVLPSLQENFAFSVAEALAAECPVVTSRQVGLADQVYSAKAGLISDMTIQAFSDAFRKLLGNERLRKEMGQNGRRLVLEKFTWDQALIPLTAIYQDILFSTRTSPAWIGGKN